MTKWLFNPFTYIAGNKALILGWLIMLLTAVIAFFSNTHFDGVLDCHYGARLPFYVSIVEMLVDWGSLSISFLVMSFFLSKTNVRYVDILGTLALSRWPLVFVAIVGLFITVPAVDKADPLSALTPSVIIGGLISLPFIIWAVALMYNAFTTSCHLKGSKAVVGFIFGLLLAEALSWYLFTLLHIYKR